MSETSKWTAQREMTLIEDMDCSFNRLIEKGNKLTAERDRYKAERDALIYAIESSLDVYTRPEIIAALDKIKEG